MANPGTARVAAIATHWNVTQQTARKILKHYGLQPVGDGWAKYRWIDIWRLEGELYVPPCHWPDFRAPLLRASELALEKADGPSPRTCRRHVNEGRLPAITLTPSIKRVRRCIFERAMPYV